MKFSILVLSIIIFLLSCTNNKKANNNDKTIIKFWHSFVASSIPAFEEMIIKYEKENHDIKIDAQYVPSGDPLVHKLITAIQSGTTPDIAWIHSDFLEKLVQANSIYPMEYFIKGKNGLTNEEYKDFFPQLLKNAKWRDTLYAIPMEATTLALLYNKTLLMENGINPPKPPNNWDELSSYVDILTIDKNEDGIFDQYGFYVPVFPASGPLSIWMLLQWEPFLWQAGGALITDDQTELIFNKKPGILALNLWKGLYNRMNFGSFSLSHDMAFASGTVAMVMDGPWNLPLYRQIKDFEWGVTRLPMGPEKEATYFSGEYLTIFKNSKYPHEAWKFIKWFTQPETQAEFSIKSGYLPVRKSTLNLEIYKNYLEEDEHLASFVDQINIAFAKTNIDYHKIEINQIVAGAIENVLVGNVKPKVALNNAKKLAEKYMRK